MRKVKPIKIEFEYEETPENEQMVQAMYNKLLLIAKSNILTGNLIKLKQKTTISARARIINDRH